MENDYIPIVARWGEFVKEHSNSEDWSEFEEDVLQAFQMVASIPSDVRNKLKDWLEGDKHGHL